MIEVVRLLYRCQLSSIDLWVEEQKIHFELPDDIAEDSVLLDEIRNNKVDVLQLLESNSCFNSKKFRTCIFHAPILSAPLSFAQERLWFFENYEELDL